MALPVIAYKSMLRETTTTITDPGTASGYAIGDIKDLRSFKIWKSSTTVKPINIDIDVGAGNATADYIALVNHNLFTLGATVEVLSGAASPAATQRLAPWTVTEDTVSYKGFTVAAAQRYWRIQITTAAASFATAPFIGECFLGMKTALPEYLRADFDPFFDGIEIAGSRSEGGHYLGGTTRGHTHRGTIGFGAAGGVRTAFTSDLNAFIDYANLRKPFFFVVDTADTDFDSPRFLKMGDTARIERIPVGGTTTRFSFEVPVEEAYMEPA